MDTLLTEEKKDRQKDADQFAKSFSELPNNKKAVVIAFMNGMEAQKAIEENQGAKEPV